MVSIYLSNYHLENPNYNTNKDKEITRKQVNKKVEYIYKENYEMLLKDIK